MHDVHRLLTHALRAAPYPADRLAAGALRDLDRNKAVNVPVIAWGLGLDRMAMVALGIHDIRELFTDNLELIRTTRRSF